MNSDFFQDPLEGQTGIFENPLLQPPGEGLEIHQNDTTPLPGNCIAAAGMAWALLAKR